MLRSMSTMSCASMWLAEKSCFVASMLDVIRSATSLAHAANRLNLWLRCPLAFRLRYIDGIIRPTTPSLFLGRMVHFGLEIYYRHRQLGIELDAAAIAARIEDAWQEAAEADNVSFGSVAEVNALKRQAATLIAAYLDHLGGDDGTVLAVEAYLEEPLIDPDTGEDLGIPLLGIVDLIEDTMDGPLIIDFKTASRGGRPPAVLHEVQLTSYAYLFRAASHSQESALEIRQLVKTKTPCVEVHRHPARTNAHFRRLFAVIRAYLDDLDSGRFIFRPGLGCHMCDFRETHCYYP